MLQFNHFFYSLPRQIAFKSQPAIGQNRLPFPMIENRWHIEYASPDWDIVATSHIQQACFLNVEDSLSNLGSRKSIPCSLYPTTCSKDWDCFSTNDRVSAVAGDLDNIRVSSFSWNAISPITTSKIFWRGRMGSRIGLPWIKFQQWPYQCSR